MSKILSLILFVSPFIVMAWLLSCGFNPWVCVTICVALLGFVIWGFGGNQVSDDN